MSLEAIAPDRALESYLTDRENSLARATLYSHRSRLGHFVRWSGKAGIENMNELSGRQLHECRIWRRMEGDIPPVTEITQMDTLRVFLTWAESIDAVEEDLPTKVLSPTLSDGENVRQVMLDPERAQRILSHLRKYEFATRPHVALTLMWHTRCASVRSTSWILRITTKPSNRSNLCLAQRRRRR